MIPCFRGFKLSRPVPLGVLARERQIFGGPYRARHDPQRVEDGASNRVATEEFNRTVLVLHPTVFFSFRSSCQHLIVVAIMWDTEKNWGPTPRLAMESEAFLLALAQSKRSTRKKV